MAYRKEYYEKNKDRFRAYSYAWRAKNRDKFKEQMLKSHRKNAMGVGPEQFAAMVVAQDNKCAICGNPETAKSNQKDGRVRALNIDHDHASGKIRGLLCSACNTALGGFKDNAELLRKAADYLDYHAAMVL